MTVARKFHTFRSLPAPAQRRRKEPRPERTPSRLRPRHKTKNTPLIRVLLTTKIRISMFAASICLTFQIRLISNSSSLPRKAPWWSCRNHSNSRWASRHQVSSQAQRFRLWKHSRSRNWLQTSALRQPQWKAASNHWAWTATSHHQHLMCTNSEPRCARTTSYMANANMEMR